MAEHQQRCLPEDVRTRLWGRVHPEWANALLTKGNNITSVIENAVKDSMIDADISKLDLCPAVDNILAFLVFTAPVDTRVLIIGQDPYIDPDQARGLSFSTPEGTLKPNIRYPASLRNIFKTLGMSSLAKFRIGDLRMWSSQGVMLANTYLTTIKTISLRHKQIWQNVTKRLFSIMVECICAARRKANLPKLAVFAWGREAQVMINAVTKKGTDMKREVEVFAHCHPAEREGNFNSCTHFGDFNTWVQGHHAVQGQAVTPEPPITWALSSDLEIVAVIGTGQAGEMRQGSAPQWMLRIKCGPNWGGIVSGAFHAGRVSSTYPTIAGVIFETETGASQMDKGLTPQEMVGELVCWSMLTALRSFTYGNITITVSNEDAEQPSILTGMSLREDHLKYISAASSAMSRNKNRQTTIRGTHDIVAPQDRQDHITWVSQNISPYIGMQTQPRASSPGVHGVFTSIPMMKR